MSLELVLPLVGLALIDSTSFGTLLIPLWLMLAPGRLRVTRVLLFLGTVGLFYFALGLALLAGATALADGISAFLATPAGAWLQLALGVGLFVLSFHIGDKKEETAQPESVVVGASGAREASDGAATGAVPAADAAAEPAPEQQPRPGRAARWRARAMGEGGSGSAAALVVLALAAAGIESASMVPYLSAIGLITASDLSLATGAVVLAGYCLLMITPALLLLLVRVVAYRWVREPLQRFEAWMSRSAAEGMSWVVGIIGILLALDALGRVGIPGVSSG